MKKSKYINKYDFINYYTKQKEMWFYSNSEIQTGIELALKKLKINNDFQDESEDDESDMIENFDSYEYFSEMKLKNENIDIDNPLIIEGNIIDQKSKEFIKSNYKIDKVFDFDDQIYKGKKLEEIAILTEEIINNNDAVIIFQSVFIIDNLITKPDAIVKINNSIIVIETKGTTSSKIVHLLDLFFQKKVLEKQSFLNCYQIKFKLCLVEYKKINKNEISLILTSFCNTSNSIKLSEKAKENVINELEEIKLKQKLKIGEYFIGDNFETIYPIEISKILNDNWEDYYHRLENTSRSNSKESLSKFFCAIKNVINDFDFTINELLNHKENMNELSYPINFIPSIKDKSFFKKNDYYDSLRKIFDKSGYEVFGYSGSILKKSNDENVFKCRKNEPLNGYFKNNDCEEFYLGDSDLKINSAASFNLLQKLKKNKIYFDFETINTATRNTNNSLPFNQIVSQCSIINWFNNEKMENLKCNNLIIDPKLINNDWFKKIIKSIYHNDDCSYIVYNKSFEKKRIEDMMEFINEKEYFEMGKKIINNLFDLADFFNPNKNLILIKELKGFYSIKKILPIIQKYHDDFFEITKSKDYNDLDIGNGILCQQKTILRFFDRVNDDEWKKLEEKLKEYCENDVRAMIAVELFIKHLIKKEEINK